MSDSLIPTEWYFIVPPAEVKIKKGSVTSEVSTYGTNQPYQNYGATKLRTITLDNVLVEGFSDGKQVEDNIVKLEAAMRMVIEEGNGYAAPFCWNLFASDKSYGIFIIQDVQVREQMRDLSGKATRARVSIKLQEVAKNQVSSGVDITTQSLGGRLTSEAEYGLALAERNSEANNQEAAIRGARGGGGAGGAGGAGGGVNPAGPGGSAPQPRPASPTSVQGQREANTQRLAEEEGLRPDGTFIR